MDALRGFAVLGILIMNIQNFSMIDAAYINPTAFGDLTGANRWTWILSHVFADQKFMSIFSLLFGAGVVLITERAAAAGRNAAGVHYRRTFWLLVIGLSHAILLWHGDILTTYGLCALAVFLFRKWNPRSLLILGMIFVSIPSLLYFLSGWSMQYWDPGSVEDTLKMWMPGTEAAAREVAVLQGGWAGQLPFRQEAFIVHQCFLFFIWFGWRAGGLMLIGMAFYKWGILTARRARAFYLRLLLFGSLIGLPLVVFGVKYNFDAGWAMESSMFFGWQFNYWGSLFTGFGYVGLAMLIALSPRTGKIIKLFAAAGRMAFTHYLLQTVICIFIFYGFGLGLYGQVERIYQILIVFGIWILQLSLSPPWLRFFRFGPVEWLWRSLTYLKLQPMRSENDGT